MSDLTLRKDKGSPLTHEEMDSNFEISNPPGAIMAFARISPPPGWLECNGQEVSRDLYSKLFDAMGTMCGAGDGINTFNLPDLRGEFIRGWDNNRGIDSGREVGSNQIDAFKSHSHGIPWTWHHGTGSYNICKAKGTDNHVRNTHNTGGSETRPRNIAMMYCIKY